jgi:Protein of unknown function (DUF3761)
MLHFKASITRTILVIAVLCGAFGQISDANAYVCNNRHYVNSSGHLVHSPSCGNESEPPQHTATCRDGSISYSEHHSGTCSGHGGVAQWD